MLLEVQLISFKNSDTVIALLVATRASADNFQGRRKVFTQQISTSLFLLHTWDSSLGKCLSLHFQLCFLYVNIKVQGINYDAHQ